MRAAIVLHVTLEIEKGKALSGLYEFGVPDVLGSAHQALCNFLFRKPFAKLSSATGFPVQLSRN